MAYMNQERKATRLPEIKRILKKYQMKGTVSVRNHMALVVTLTQGKLDIIGNYLDNERFADKYDLNKDNVTSLDINSYHIDRDFTGKEKEFLEELKSALLGNDYYNNDDIQTDYFDRSHYIEIHAGKWNKPYIYHQ